MMSEREIFEAAAEIQDTVRRATFLNQVCGDDCVLLARIKSLLGSHEMDSQFLRIPALEQWKSVEERTPTEPSHKQPKVPESGGSSHRGNIAKEEELDLSFLNPSTRPGSIGSLGHYEILQTLGNGSFGVVFRAFDEQLHRQVAIKAMSPRLAATSPSRKRFLREARSAAAIRHENIVQVYSVEELPLPYLVMEFVDGQTLQQKFDGTGPLEVPEILHLGRQIASGLAAAHAQGLIHRDITPGNILIETGVQQKIKITDFGLARAVDDASISSSGVIAGTPMYMAPEQAQGHALDHRVDLFSLGSVLYQMASGRPPFRAASIIAVLRRVVDQTPRPIREIIPTVPEWMCEIISRLHAKQPADRIQTAAELAELLTRCQSELQRDGKVTSVSNPLRENSAVEESQTADANLVTKVDPAGITPDQARERSPSRAPNWFMITGFLSLAALIGIFVRSGSEAPPGNNSLRPSIDETLNGDASRPTDPREGPSVSAESESLVEQPANQSRRDGMQNNLALELNGTTDWIQLPIADDRDGPFTIEAYVQFTDKRKRMETIVAAFIAPNGIGMTLFENQLEAAISFANDPTWSTAKSGILPETRKANHLAVVFDGRILRVYLNGHLVSQSEPPNPHVPSQGRFCLGGFEGQDLLAGQIDEIRFSKTARYQRDFIPSPRFEPDTETLALYHCDDDHGDVLQDSSEQRLHGKIFGAARVPSFIIPRQP